jgi:DNA-binding transcriptional regulator YiaG
MRGASDQLRAMMREHHLTRARAAEILDVPLDTVHNWLAPESNHKHRAMPARMLRLLELELQQRGE